MTKKRAGWYAAAQAGYACFLRIAQSLFGVDFAKQIDAKLRFHRKLNLKNPQTLADKVSYISLHTLPELAVTCTDKWEVRSYVRNKGLGEILIPVYGGAISDADDLDFLRLPDRFVLKATHGCRMNLVCTDKTELSEAACRETIARWLRTTYGTYSMEPHYRSIPHRVYCEECLGAPEQMVDYKIHCLNGEPSFILVCNARTSDADQASAVTMNLYDLDWNWIDGLQTYGRHCPGKGNVPRPEHLEQMIQIARVLSADFDFVRVDLYDIKGKVYFGELTFTPANGVFPSYKEELLKAEGKKLRITER